MRQSKDTKHAARNVSRPVLVKGVAEVFHELHPTASNFRDGVFPALDVLYLGCGGCEYPVIAGLDESGLLAHVGVLHILTFMVVDDTELVACTLSKDPSPQLAIPIVADRYAQTPGCSSRSDFAPVWL